MSAAARPVRVAVVAACPFPSLRGSQVLVRELAEGLAQSGHVVHVVTYPTAQHLVPIERIAIHRARKLPGLWTARPFGWQKLVLDLLLLWTLWRVVRRHAIEVIHAHNVEAPLLAFIVRALTGVPVVYHAHNALADELPCYFRRRFARRLARRAGAACDRVLARGADRVIALSDRLAAYLAVRGAAGRLQLVPPVAPRLPRLPVARPLASNGGPLVMYSGNLDPYQDLGCLLEAFLRLRAAEPRARLVLVTHRGAHPNTARRAARLTQHPGVSVTEVPSFAAAVRLLATADILVCPRGSWSGFPIKAVNYMALGRPIVHARASAHAIEDGVTGLVVEDGNAGALARAMLRIARDPVLAAQLGRAARRTARERFGLTRALNNLLDVYEQVRVGSGRDGGSRGGPMEQEMNEQEQRRVQGSPRRPDRWLRREAAGLVSALLVGVLVVGCTTAPVDAPLPPVGDPLSPSLVDTGQYKLEPGDVLRVKFIYQPEMDVRVEIDPDGNIAIPGVGELQARGKTAEELATDIQTLSSATLRDPEVTVIVAQLGPRKVYVGGEVRLPGPVLYRVGMTPMQAILDRGGFTEVARIDSVLHVTSKGHSVEPTATRLDFSGELKQGEPELQTLAVNDVIYVPRTFIGDANAFVRLYIRGLMPTMPRFGVGLNP